MSEPRDDHDDRWCEGLRTAVSRVCDHVAQPCEVHHSEQGQAERQWEEAAALLRLEEVESRVLGAGTAVQA